MYEIVLFYMHQCINTLGISGSNDGAPARQGFSYYGAIL